MSIAPFSPCSMQAVSQLFPRGVACLLLLFIFPHASFNASCKPHPDEELLLFLPSLLADDDTVPAFAENPLLLCGGGELS